MPTMIETEVYKPLAYFSYFGYPLTAFEIWKWQFEPETNISFNQIEDTLDNSKWLNERVSSINGMYSIGSKQDAETQTVERHVRYLDAIEKERKLARVLTFLRRVPGVRGVALCNSMPFHFTRSQSDIDLFVITDQGAVWSTRLLSVAPLMALKQRPGETDHHPIDLSFFVSEDAMDLFSLQKTDDPYFAFWIATLTPVLGERELWDRFFDENSWAFAKLPNAKPPVRSFRYRRRNVKARLPGLSESFARRIQEGRLPQDLRDAANTDSRVVINNRMLKFHRTDRREEIAQAFNAQMQVCKD
ncbi:hypothetical protein HON52_03290 [Candidatus Uhrbacteria bacterium]|jgi:hypothetical protein|nr:hypothetical protein [Candidatus Uhrbacteria bacterium]